MPSSSSSFGLMRQVGSRIAGVSQIMRMQASSICSRSNSAWRQRPPLRLGDADAARRHAIVLVAQLLLLGHRHEIGLHRAAGQLALDIGFAAAQHHRLQRGAAARRGSCSRSGGRARRARRSRG